MKKTAKKVMKDFVKDFKENLKDLKSKKTFYRQIPNLLTGIRALVPIPFNILYFSNHFIAATIVLFIGLITDFLDGKIARKYHLSSSFGATLDSVCDKLMVIGVIIPAAFTYYGLFINLFLEIVITFINCKAVLLGIPTKSSLLGKLKTWPLFISIILAYLCTFIEIPVILLTVLITITAGLQLFTALDYFSKNFFHKNKNEK